jgi:hypothetical protein
VPGFGCVFTDTWPAEKVLLELLWDMAHGRLDVWHWMRRITKFLRDTHCKYGAALVVLSKVVFLWNEDDITAVDQTLLDGSLNGTRHSLVDLEDVKSSGL